MYKLVPLVTIKIRPSIIDALFSVSTCESLLRSYGGLLKYSSLFNLVFSIFKKANDWRMIMVKDLYVTTINGFTWKKKDRKVVKIYTNKLKFEVFRFMHFLNDITTLSRWLDNSE